MIKNFQELVSEIKTQVPIQELISEFIPVKKSGRGFVALCPFHDDHHPSLQIHPQKGIFKCFSCGTGGDLITFYALINKKKWSEAIPELASKYGLKVEYGNVNKVELEIKDKLFELNRSALDFFKDNLHSIDSKESLKYLKEKRKLTDTTIDKYEIGLAKNSWDLLFNYLTKTKGYTQELILASGLFIQRENEQGYYDRFRNRIIFPIYNEVGKVIGFGGRIFTASNEEPKYINSPETLIFIKGSNLYGLNFAKDEIKNKDYVILTEGYLDVLTAHQHGLLNTVATLGTAFTVQQARLLTKHTESKKVCLCLDSDVAGKKAIESVFKLSQEISQYVSLDLRVISNLQTKDLDESLNTEGVTIVREKVRDAGKLMHFIIDKISKEYIESTNEITKKIAMENLVEIIIAIRDPIEQNEYTKHISHRLNIEEELINIKIRDKIKSIKQKKLRFNKPTENKEDDIFKMHSTERFKHAELELLSLYISSFPNSNEIKDNLNQIEFIDEKHKLIKDFLNNVSNHSITPQEVINELILQFNEYKHIMSIIADLAWRIEIDNTNYNENKDKILKESKEWITWWVKNKQKLKSLSLELKECKDEKKENDILSKMLELVKNT